MTLILSFATNDFAFQISDRRLTFISGANSGNIAEDDRNKAVLVAHRMSVGYTGLANLGDQRTDDWLAHTAADGDIVDLKSVCDRIAERASSKFRQLPWSRPMKRHAFVGVGWTTWPSYPPLQPTLCTISNALGPDGEWLAEAADEFKLEVNSWGDTGGGFRIAATGQTLTPNEKYHIWRLLRRCVKGDCGPSALMRALVMAMDFVADRYKSVGRNLMFVSLPRIAAENYVSTGEWMIMSSEPLRDHNTFLYLPVEGQPVAYGPHVAGKGIAMLNFKQTWPTSDDD
jgi:hypothetical protein